MQISTVGIDLAKNVFQVHGANEHGKPVLRKQLRRDQVVPFFANLPPCLVGMEACGGAHHWARKLQTLGHTVKLMAPQFVKPYVKSNKNDVADAQAICEAVSRPTMRFVPVKSIEQQSVLALHRVRQGFVKARTAQANQIRGLLSEFGLAVPQGIAHIASRVPELIEDASNQLTGDFRCLIDRLLDHLKVLDTQIRQIEVRIKAWHQSCEMSRRLEKVPGIGLLTATAIAATVADGKNELRQRAAVRRVAGSRAPATLQRGEVESAWNEQTWGCVPAHPTDPRRPIRDLSGEPATRGDKLATQTHDAAQRQCRSRGACEQDGPDRLGATTPRQGVRRCAQICKAGDGDRGVNPQLPLDHC